MPFRIRGAEAGGVRGLEAQLRRSSRYFDLSRDLSVACSFDGQSRA